MVQQPPEPVILPSAHRRRIPDADILHAYDNPIRIWEQDDEMFMFIGADRAGNMLEVGVVYSGVVYSTDGPVIPHAMPDRDKYL